ncbi:MAG: hypothetical protein N2Z20_05140 [Elusimicrobiales bacterium]|nr:hypothetical protein [Elusimicrobiales bacterium]
MKKFLFLIYSILSLLKLSYAEKYELIKLSLMNEINMSNLRNIEISQIKNISPRVDLKYTSKMYSYLNMYINKITSIKEIKGADYRNGIEVSIKKVYDGRFDGNIRIDGRYEMISYLNYSSYLSIHSSYGNLRASKTGDNYYINGSIRSDDGKYNYINVAAYKKYNDEYSYNVNGTGLSLDFSNYSVTGNFNEQMYSKRAIAYLIGMIFCLQLELEK